MTENDDDQLFGDAHVKAYQETGGERGYDWRGTKILLLKTKGSSSGAERIAPLIMQPDGEDYVIVASKGGAPEHPAWFKNMRANPDDVEVQVKADVFPATMSVAEGTERERLWTLMTQAWPDYDEYAKKTDREIPVVVLSRR